jgi:hypothetical protein
MLGEMLGNGNFSSYDIMMPMDDEILTREHAYRIRLTATFAAGKSVKWQLNEAPLRSMPSISDGIHNIPTRSASSQMDTFCRQCEFIHFFILTLPPTTTLPN